MILLKSLLFETLDTYEFPIEVKGSYTGMSCDEFHAFNDTGGRVVGGMNNKVNAKLEELYNSGINPDITNIEISMDNKTYSVSWKVTIEKSTDNKAWIGLYSRGAGGSDAITRANPMVSSNYTSIEQCKKSSAILKRGTVGDMKQILDYKYNPASGCKVRQIFYKYTLKQYPGANLQTLPKGKTYKDYMPYDPPK